MGLLRIVMLLAILFLVNFIGSQAYKRFDLTAEGRYTLSKPTIQLLHNLDDVVVVNVFLQGEFPAGFKRLQTATSDMLYEFKNVSGGKVIYRFINPSAGDYEERNKMYKLLYDKGLSPTNLKEKTGDGTKNKIIFPGMILRYHDKEFPVQLLESQVGLGPEEVLNNSIELLEYKIANGIKKVTQRESPKIGFIQGEGELTKYQMADFLQTLYNAKYDVRLIDLPNTLTLVNKYKTIVIAKPTQPFDEKDKFKIDQFIMNGGEVLWLIDESTAVMDSLKGKTAFMAMNMPHNLDDQLFRYGVRINADLVEDMQCNVIPLVTNQGNPPQTEFFPWPFFPVVTSYSSNPQSVGLPKPHLIAKNLDAVAFQFVSTIDTIRVPGVKKTPILHTSAYSKAIKLPARLHFSMMQTQPDQSSFTRSYLPVAYLLEGNFTSAFKNRLSAQTLEVLQDSLEGVSFRDSSLYAKMIVIGDGDVIANEIASDGNPYPLGYYPYTKQTFANKDLLLNCIEYLTDENQLIATRNREIKLRLLDKLRVEEEGNTWKTVNMVVPVFIIALFGFIYNRVRKRKYTRVA